MLVEPVMQIIERAGLALAGQNLFAHYAPGNVTGAIIVLPTLAGNHISYEMPGWRKNDTFQVLARGGGALAARNLCSAVMVALVNTQQTPVKAVVPGIPDVVFSYIRAMHDPIIYPRQLGGEWEASVNYQATYAIQSDPLNATLVSPTIIQLGPAALAALVLALPTSPNGLAPGDMWNDSGTPKLVPGGPPGNDNLVTIAAIRAAIAALPTDPTGLVVGDLWIDGGTLKVVQ